MRYVIGGNIREAEDLIRRKQFTDCVPLDRAEMLESIDAPEVILTGTFIARRRAGALRCVQANQREPASFAKRAVPDGIISLLV